MPDRESESVWQSLIERRDSPLDLIAAPQRTIRPPAAAAVTRGDRGEGGGPLEADLKVIKKIRTPLRVVRFADSASGGETLSFG